MNNDPRFTPLINEKIEKAMKLISSIIHLDEDIEGVTLMIRKSDYCKNESSYSGAIFIALDIAFFRPDLIPNSVQMIKILHNSEYARNHISNPVKILLKRTFHWYFNEFSDEVYVFIFYILASCIQENLLKMEDFLDKFEKVFVHKQQYRNQICKLGFFFFPEIQELRPKFFMKLREFMNLCHLKKLLSPKVEYLINNYDNYSKDNWKLLKQMRTSPTDDGIIISSLVNDDLEAFKKSIEIAGGDLNNTVENLPLTCYTLLDSKFPYINAAAILGAVKIFKYLYENGVSLDSKCGNGATIAQCTFVNPEQEIIDILIKEKVDMKDCLVSLARTFKPNAIDEFLHMVPKGYFGISPTGTTALVQSIMSSNFKVLKYCLESGADINQSDGYNITPFLGSCENGNFYIMEILFELGADITKGYPLILASKAGHTSIMEFLIEKNVDPDQINDDEMTPLYAAIANSHFDAVRLLIDNKQINLKRRFKKGITYINIAAMQNDVRIVKIVLESVKIDIKDLDVSPLFNAIIGGFKEAFIFLLSVEGIDVDCLTKATNVSAIWLTIKCQQYDILEEILTRKICKISSNDLVLAKNIGDERILNLLINDSDNNNNYRVFGKRDDDDDDDDEEHEEEHEEDHEEELFEEAEV